MLVLTISLAQGFNETQRQNLEDNTILYWSFDNSSDRGQDLVGSYPITTIQSGVSFPDSSTIGSEASCDGTSNARMYLSSFLTTNQNFAFSFWINTTNYNPSSVGFIFGENSDSVSEWGVYLSNTYSSRLRTYNGNNMYTEVLTNNQKYFITVRKTDDYDLIYTNGVLTENYTRGTISNTVSQFGLCGRTGVSSWNFNGQIDEVAFYNNLTQDDINFLYNSGDPTTNQQYPYSIPTPPTVSNFTTTLTDTYNNADLTPYNVSIEGFYNNTQTVTINFTSANNDFKNENISLLFDGDFNTGFVYNNSADPLDNGNIFVYPNSEEDTYAYDVQIWFQTVNYTFKNISRTTLNEFFRLKGTYNFPSIDYELISDEGTIDTFSSITSAKLTEIVIKEHLPTTFVANSSPFVTPIPSNTTGLYNITFSKTGYFPTTYENRNLSTDLDADITGTNVTLRIVFNNTNVTADISNTTLQDLNNSLTWVNNTGYFNIQPYPLEPITFQISCNRSVFETKNFTLTFGAQDTNEYIIYVEPTTNTLTFYDLENSSPISNASVTVTYPDSGYELDLTTNSTGQVEFSYVYNNVTEFGNYTFAFDKLGYNLITVTEEITSDEVPVNLNYNISRSTLFINVYHRENSTLMDGINVSLSLLGVFNQTTNNGTFTYQDLALISQEYTLQAIADGYGTEQITFDYTNQENLTVNIYMIDLNNSDTGTLFVQIIDEFYFKQIEATVTLLEYSTSQNGFITVSECLTNTNGECVFNIELNSKTYLIKAAKEINGRSFTASSGTAGEIIKTDQEVRRLILRTFEEFETTSIDNLKYSIVANDDWNETNTSIITVDFETYDNTVTTVCIEYFVIEGLLKTSALKNCTTSSGAVSNVGVSIGLNRSKYYQAEVYQQINGAKQLLRQIIYPSNLSASEVFGKEGANKFLIVLSFVLILGVSLYAKNIMMFFIMAMFTIWIDYNIFPQDLMLEVVVAINIICLMGIYISRKKIQEG